MKIAWFSPFSQKSAIGKYSRLITEELTSSCEVHLWVPKDKDLLTTSVTLFQFDSSEDLSSRLSSYDIIIYNLGDHYGYHHDIYDISKKQGGVVILHDYIMHHFFYAYYLIHNKMHQEYVNDMKFYYGEQGEHVANSLLQGVSIPDWDTKIMEYPLFEKTLEGALGVICHSLIFADKVVRVNNRLPVSMIRLPFKQSDTSPGSLKFDKEAWGIPSNKIMLLTIGHVNPNKRIGRIIEIIGKHKELRENIVYVSIGSYDHNPLFQDYLSLLDNYDLHDVVKFLGYQPDDILHAFMSSADIFINLRSPVMEGGSASVAEQMLYERPVIVSNEGHYMELPDECVIKIGMNQEEKHLVNALQLLMGDEAYRREIGRRGKIFALEEFSVAKYCQALIAYLSEVRTTKPFVALTDRIAQEFDAMNVHPESEVLDAVAGEVLKIFGH
jgi:glycosyltransferase involved in cell wall biosynthesis